MKKGINAKFNMFLNINLVGDALLALFGIILLFADVEYSLIGLIGGLLFAYYAAVLIYTFISRNGAKLYFLNVGFGAIMAIIALVMIAGSATSDFLMNTIGVFFIVNGASKINYALWLKRGEEETWIITIATGAMLVVISLIFMLSEFYNIDSVVLVGIFLLCGSAINLMNVILFKQRSKEIVNIFW